jgi:hypothetical protein
MIISYKNVLQTHSVTFLFFKINFQKIRNKELCLLYNKETRARVLQKNKRINRK